MVAILLHVFHTDLWPEILVLLSEVKDLIAIDVSLSESNDNTQILEDLKQFNIIRVRYTDNHGVDISPFLHQIKELDSKQYPYFVKLHTKKSVINKFQWRLVLFNALIGSKQILESNIDKLDNNPGIGAITDKTTIMSSIGYNKHHIEILCNFLDLKGVSNKKFMAGNMFMSRTKIFQKYLNTKTIYYIDMLLENGVVKDEYYGTFCHGMERIFGKIIHKENLKIAHSSLEPYIKIYNHQLKKTFVLYKCHKNNYCYNFDPGHRVFGSVYSMLSDPGSIMIDWQHLHGFDHHFKIYSQVKDGKYACLV